MKSSIGKNLLIMDVRFDLELARAIIVGILKSHCFAKILPGVRGSLCPKISCHFLIACFSWLFCRLQQELFIYHMTKMQICIMQILQC